MNGAETNKRFFVLDIIRGLAVLLMVLAHSVYFFHNGTNPLLLGLETIGNTLAFTTFLIVSGASTYIAYFKKRELEESKKKKLLKRILILLFSYYALAIIVSLKSIISAVGIDWFKEIFNIVIFKNVPSFTEFIVPFIFFSIFVYLLPKFFYSVSSSIPKSIFFSTYIYLTAIAVNFLSVPKVLEPWKALLAGQDGYYRFPILYYMPIFILGAVWGYWLVEKPHQKQKEEISKFLSIISLVGISAVFLANTVASRSNDIFSLRWPPSIPFLLVGVLFTFTTAVILYWSKQLGKLPLFRDIFLLFGQNAYGIFWAHTLLINIYALSGATKVGSTTIFFAISILIILTSVALATFVPFNFKFALTFRNKDHCAEEAMLRSEPIYKVSGEIYAETKTDIRKIKNFFFPRHTGDPTYEKLIKKRHFLAGAIITIIISFIGLPAVSKEAQKILSPHKTPTWYSTDFGYRSQITVKNQESFSAIPKNSALKFTINHKALVSQGKSNPDGTDLKMVHWNGSSYSDIPVYSNGWNQDSTSLYFFTPEKISETESNSSFYLYYRNKLASTLPSKKSFSEWEYKYSINLAAEEAHNPFLRVDKLWHLKSGEGNNLSVSLSDKNQNNYKKITVEILETSLKADMQKGDSEEWETSIGIEQLKPGKYQIQATLDNNTKSQKAYFYVSYPLYVTWTIDWEGFDASDTYINALSQVADKHNIPMTHLFNPRIFTTSSVSPASAQHYKDWVISRWKNKGEEIGMHIHWYDDFVKNAGVEIKKQYSWGDSGIGGGYETLPSNFTKDELVKMISYGKNLFKANGLPEPISYRAGGWFANIDLLNALVETGFKIDTSGRTHYKFGPNNAEGYWNLSETQQPYKPSKTNQNKQLESNLSLWEVPNNGADSYWFSSADMISRFNKNYTGGILEHPVEVTFLSHPNWFNAKEKQKVEAVFSHTDNYSSTKDLGPVKYSTLETIYQEWLNKE